MRFSQVDIKPYDTNNLKTATLDELETEKKNEKKTLSDKNEKKEVKPLVDNQRLENITSDITKDFEHMSYDP